MSRLQQYLEMINKSEVSIKNEDELLELFKKYDLGNPLGLKNKKGSIKKSSLSKKEWLKSIPRKYPMTIIITNNLITGYR